MAMVFKRHEVESKDFVTFAVGRIIARPGSSVPHSAALLIHLGLSFTEINFLLEINYSQNLPNLESRQFLLSSTVHAQIIRAQFIARVDGGLTPENGLFDD